MTVTDIYAYKLLENMVKGKFYLIFVLFCISKIFYKQTYTFAALFFLKTELETSCTVDIHWPFPWC